MRMFAYGAAVQEHPVPRRPHAADMDAVVETFKALSDPTRARVVLALAGGERTVSALVAWLALPQSHVSRHLAVLRAAGVVAARREANHVYYRLADAHVGRLVQQAFAHAEHVRLGLPDHPAPDHRADYPRDDHPVPARLAFAGDGA